MPCSFGLQPSAFPEVAEEERMVASLLGSSWARRSEAQRYRWSDGVRRIHSVRR